MWESDQKTTNMEWTLNFCESKPGVNEASPVETQEEVVVAQSFADLLMPPETNESLASEDIQEQQLSPTDDVVLGSLDEEANTDVEAKSGLETIAVIDADDLNLSDDEAVTNAIGQALGVEDIDIAIESAQTMTEVTDTTDLDAAAKFDF